MALFSKVTVEITFPSELVLCLRVPREKGTLVKLGLKVMEFKMVPHPVVPVSVVVPLLTIRAQPSLWTASRSLLLRRAVEGSGVFSFS